MATASSSDDAVLTAAVSEGRAADVEALLKEHPTATTRTPFGDMGSLLHVAAEAGHVEVRFATACVKRIAPEKIC